MDDFSYEVKKKTISFANRRIKLTGDMLFGLFL